MKDYVVYNDIHIGSLYELPMSFEKDAIYNGDIYDLSGCLNSHVHRLEGQMRVLDDFAMDRYIHGNHECSRRSLTDYFIDEKVIFVHGHTLTWSKKKVKKWSRKEKGKGKTYRRVSMWFNGLRRLKKISLKDKTLEKAWELARRHGCNTVVCGHKHSRANVEELITRKGSTVRVIFLPRGRNEIRV